MYFDPTLVIMSAGPEAEDFSQAEELLEMSRRAFLNAADCWARQPIPENLPRFQATHVIAMLAFDHTIHLALEQDEIDDTTKSDKIAEIFLADDHARVEQFQAVAPSGNFKKDATSPEDLSETVRCRLEQGTEVPHIYYGLMQKYVSNLSIDIEKLLHAVAPQPET